MRITTKRTEEEATGLRGHSLWLRELSNFYSVGECEIFVLITSELSRGCFGYALPLLFTT